MKNAVFYKDMWLAKGSQALELYNEWMKTKAPADKTRLDNHLKVVNTNYDKLTGIVTK